MIVTDTFFSILLELCISCAFSGEESHDREAEGVTEPDQNEAIAGRPKRYRMRKINESKKAQRKRKRNLGHCYTTRTEKVVAKKTIQ